MIKSIAMALVTWALSMSAFAGQMDSFIRDQINLSNQQREQMLKARAEGGFDQQGCFSEVASFAEQRANILRWTHGQAANEVQALSAREFCGHDYVPFAVKQLKHDAKELALAASEDRTSCQYYSQVLEEKRQNAIRKAQALGENASVIVNANLGHTPVCR